MTKKLYSNLSIINLITGEILFLKRAVTNDFCPGDWCLPGGHMDEDEEPGVCALREAKEETGLDFIGKLIPQYMHTHKTADAVCFYYCVYIDDPARYGILQLDMNEHQQYAWLTPFKAIEADELMLDLGTQLKKMFFRVQ